MREMGCESSASPSGKRSRDAKDEVYLDNFHSHKRYLSEVMASSLNGLSVGESLPEHLMESPARSETASYKVKTIKFVGPSKTPIRENITQSLIIDPKSYRIKC